MCIIDGALLMCIINDALLMISSTSNNTVFSFSKWLQKNKWLQKKGAARPPRPPLNPPLNIYFVFPLFKETLVLALNQSLIYSSSLLTIGKKKYKNWRYSDANGFALWANKIPYNTTNQEHKLEIERVPQ